MSPYKITGPALISFSGGRTSAFMLHQIVQAHGGTLPDDVRVVFANTGKEREETLRFVHECGTRWGVHVHWVEWRDSPDGFDIVSFNSASRNGEPFARLIAKRNFLPNAVTRYCTTQLKVRPIGKLAQSWGWSKWTSVIGLRYDEGHRVLKAIARNDAGKDRWRTAMPMSKAKHTRADVMEFWAQQPFDLGLMGYEGNCDLCFLKARAKIQTIMRERPGTADWWIDQERRIKDRAMSRTVPRFVTEYTYAQLSDEVARQGFLPFADDDEHDAECGLLCAS